MNNLTDNTRKFSAEEIRNLDTIMEPVPGSKPEYSQYSKAGYTDRDLIFRFQKYLPKTNLEALNKKLNKTATEYDENTNTCPNCGNHLDAINNDGNFCKFCGQHIKRNDSISVGEGIKKARLKRSMKQSELAESIGVSNCKMCFYEKGDKIPTTQDLVHITHALKCSIEELLGESVPRACFIQNSGIYASACTEYEKPSLEPKPLDKAEDVEGYDNEYIYTCPFCGEEVDLSPGEALTTGLSTYEIMKERSEGNDGLYCKHCGQALERPVMQDEKRMLNNYAFWIKRAM